MSLYRGRLAPSPTGFLHLGHAATFWVAHQRAREAGGRLVLRVEDIDTARCKLEFTEALFEDLRWFGLSWDEGPDKGGPFAPYLQSARRKAHLNAWRRLYEGGFLYPCRCSRRDIQQALSAPHLGEEEPNYPGTCRPAIHEIPKLEWPEAQKKRDTEKFSSFGDLRRPENLNSPGKALLPGDTHWRFRVPQGERMCFVDGLLGPQTAVAGVDFGDFIVWRRDGVPAYQLAVVADDAAMGITEVVRGRDLLVSTFRQLLLYRALGLPAPRFCHAPLLTDPATGQRLAKRHAALSLRELRTWGESPEALRRRVREMLFKGDETLATDAFWG